MFGKRMHLLQVKSTGAEESEQSDDDQIDGDDIVQQARYHQNKYASDKRNEWADT